MENLLYQYNPWWENGKFAEDFKRREKYLTLLRIYLDRKQIVILTGLRRVGKTTLMKLLIKELIDTIIDANYVFYVSLDDYLLTDNSISEIVNEFRKIHKINIDEKVYLFFDEVTYKNDFQVQLKNIYDSQNVKIFAASSSASLLRDKKAHLTGRSITLEIEPLDLDEYLYFNGIEIKNGIATFCNPILWII